MKSLFKISFFVLLFATILCDAFGQIVVNGRNPRRYRNTGSNKAVTVSYGNNFWVDGQNVPLKGQSEGKPDMSALVDHYSIEKWNVSSGISVGFEKGFSEKFGIRTTFSTAKLITGTSTRMDLTTVDESKFTQLGVYSRYTLTKDRERRFQFQWLTGPELIYAKKNIVVKDYMATEDASPGDYRQDVSVVEGALVTGLGMSFRVTKAFAIFSDGMLGISLPGKGLKITNSGFGLKYSW